MSVCFFHFLCLLYILWPFFPYSILFPFHLHSSFHSAKASHFFSLFYLIPSFSSPMHSFLSILHTYSYLIPPHSIFHLHSLPLNLKATHSFLILSHFLILFPYGFLSCILSCHCFLIPPHNFFHLHSSLLTHSNPCFTSFTYSVSTHLCSSILHIIPPSFHLHFLYILPLIFK